MEHASILARKSFWPRLLAALALLAMLIVGRYTYRDYGITVDETVERDSTLINYQYAFQTLFGRDLSLSDQPLETYKDRHYGVTLQMPTVMVEHLTGFTMPSRDIYMLRHLWTFLLCLSGLACFYLFLERVFSNRWYALLGLLMLALYPRFWGEQFTNIKDMVFMATCCWALLATALSLRHEGKWRWEVLSALLFALCANTRIIGFLFPSLLFGYRVLRDGVLTPVWKEGGARRFFAQLAKHALALLLMLVCYVLVTPAAWASPLRFIIEAFANSQTITTGTAPSISWETVIHIMRCHGITFPHGCPCPFRYGIWPSCSPGPQVRWRLSCAAAAGWGAHCAACCLDRVAGSCCA